MRDNFFEDLQVIMVDRINAAQIKDKEYKKALSAESAVYETLMSQLKKPQQKMLEEYYILSSATTAVCEKIAYKQGVEDLADMLLKDEKGL